MARTYWLPRWTASTSLSRRRSRATMGAAMASAIRTRAINTITPSSRNPSSPWGLGLLVSCGLGRERGMFGRARKALVGDKREDLLIAVGHVFYLDGVGRDGGDLITAEHDVAFVGEDYVVAVE